MQQICCSATVNFLFFFCRIQKTFIYIYIHLYLRMYMYLNESASKTKQNQKKNLWQNNATHMLFSN